MAVTQTLVVTDNSGSIHLDMDSLMTQFIAEVSGLADVHDHIGACTTAGTLTNTSVLSEDGTAVTITRVWNDTQWAELVALDYSASDIADGDWTVVSSDDS